MRKDETHEREGDEFQSGYAATTRSEVAEEGGVCPRLKTTGSPELDSVHNDEASLFSGDESHQIRARRASTGSPSWRGRRSPRMPQNQRDKLLIASTRVSGHRTADSSRHLPAATSTGGRRRSADQRFRSHTWLTPSGTPLIPDIKFNLAELSYQPSLAAKYVLRDMTSKRTAGVLEMQLMLKQI